MGKGKAGARRARGGGGGGNSPQQKAGPQTKRKGGGGGGRAARRQAAAAADSSWRSPVCPRTERRECEGRQERQQRRAGERYPHYYVTHALVWRDNQGRARRKPICDDCHNNEWLAYELRWLREQGYGRDDAVVVQADQVLADAAAAEAAPPADRSASGAAIEAAGGMLVHDPGGELCEIELAECRLLPEGDEQLQEEIALLEAVTRGFTTRRDLLARNGREYERAIAELRAERDALAATDVDPAAVERLVNQLTGAGRITAAEGR